MELRKAVIPAAGLGTRILPVSKVVPKELLPLVDRPVIHYIVEEAIHAGFTHIIFVTAPDKYLIQNYFSKSSKLEEILTTTGKQHLLDPVNRLIGSAKFTFVQQENPLGLGHAVLMARDAVGDEPFAVLLPDDLILNEQNSLSLLREVHATTLTSVLAVQTVTKDLISSYGIIRPSKEHDETIRVRGLVEKPTHEEAPSNLGIIGRYILTPRIFSLLEHASPGIGDEIQLTDALNHLLEHEEIYARHLKGTRYDTGSPLGLLKANLAVALRRNDLSHQAAQALSEELTIPRGPEDNDPI